jgi:Rha family phage regulatory protein
MTESAITGTTTAVSVFAPELSNENGQITTTSLQIAQHFNKAHRAVLLAIKNLLAQIVGEGLHNFMQSSYLNEQGKQQPMYRITRDGFTLLAMGFTGKEALQWKLAYLSAFNKMEAELVKLAQPVISLTITPAQCQHLRELVQLVVESGKQGHGETWNRLHRKMKVNSYLMLRPDQFDAACQYLRGKFDDTSIAVIAQKHFPQIARIAHEPQQPSNGLRLSEIIGASNGMYIDSEELHRIATICMDKILSRANFYQAREMASRKAVPL